MLLSPRLNGQQQQVAASQASTKAEASWIILNGKKLLFLRVVNSALCALAEL